MGDFLHLLPELFLALTLAGVIAGEIAYHGERVRLVTITALVGLGAAFIQVILSYQFGSAQLFGQSLSIDGFALFFKLFFIALAALTVGISIHAQEISSDRKSEFCALIVASALAMCLAASAANLLLIFLALQAVQLFGYILTAYRKSSVASTEAAVKQLLFGVVSAGLFLFGIAILFAATKSLNIYEIHRTLATSPLPESTGKVIFGLIFLSLTMQIAAFPSYLWAPDVLEGAPTPVSNFLALGPRVASFAVALRFLLVVFSVQDTNQAGLWRLFPGLEWPSVVALASGLTMACGALLALRQTGAKRLVASLVVAQSGFLLIGLLVLDEVGLAALLYNLLVELFSLTGIFFVLSYLYDRYKSDQLVDLRGAMRASTPECVSLLLFLGALVGLPPFPGFIGKFALVGAAVRHDWNFLAAVAVLCGTLSIVAIARLAFTLVGDFRPGLQTTVASASSLAGHDRQRQAILSLLLAGIAALTVFANSVLNWAGQSLRFIFW